MTIAEAAAEALNTLHSSATVREIYDEIERRRLFQFGAKDPVSVLGSAIRRRAKGSSTLRGDALFVLASKGKYRLL